MSNLIDQQQMNDGAIEYLRALAAKIESGANILAISNQPHLEEVKYDQMLASSMKETGIKALVVTWDERTIQ